MSTTTREQWQLERASAEAYERYAVASWSGPLAARLMALAAPREGERVLDVACGTGVVARLAAAAVGARGAVAGVDLNEGMLAVAREQAPAVDWRQGDVEALPVADGAFELVACQQGLQFFGHRAGALAEMRRVLAPGGRLALSVMRPIAHNAGWGALAAALARHVGPEAGAVMRAPFPTGTRPSCASSSRAPASTTSAWSSRWRARAIRRPPSSSAGRARPRRWPGR